MKTETSLVIWLNSCSKCPPFVRTLREDVHAIRQNCIVSDGLVNAMPNMQQTLLQI